RIAGEMRAEARDVFGALAELLTDKAALTAHFREHAKGDLTPADLADALQWNVARMTAALAEMDARADEREERREEKETATEKREREADSAEVASEAGVSLVRRRRASDEDDEDDTSDDVAPHVGVDGRDEIEEARATMDAEDDTLLLRLW